MTAAEETSSEDEVLNEVVLSMRGAPLSTQELCGREVEGPKAVEFCDAVVRFVVLRDPDFDEVGGEENGDTIERCKPGLRPSTLLKMTIPLPKCAYGITIRVTGVGS